MASGGRSNVTTVHLGTIRVICRTLAEVLQRSYGPRGLQTLLATDKGHLLVTNAGLRILGALHLSHPISKLIVNSLNKAVTFTGDGSKTLVLWLAESVSQLEQQILKQGDRIIQGASASGHQQRFESQSRIQMSVGFQNILLDLCSGLVQYIRRHITYCQCKDSLQASPPCIRKVILTVFMPHFPKNISTVFTDLICQILQLESKQDMAHHIQAITNNMDRLCVRVSGRPYTASTVLDSFVIQRNFTVHCPDAETNEVRFVILRCLLGQLNHEKTNNEKIKLTSSQMMGQFLQSQKVLIKGFITTCKKNGINLILSTEKVPDFVQHFCQVNHISVIEFMLEEDVDFLETHLSISAISNIFDRIEEQNMYTAKFCKPIVIADRRCVHLSIPELPQSLVVCGMTDGLCKQVELVAIKALKTLFHCYKMDSYVAQLQLQKRDNSVVRLSSRNKKDGRNDEICDNGSDDAGNLLELDWSSSDSCRDFKPNTAINEHPCVCHNVLPGNGVFEFIVAKYCMEMAKKTKTEGMSYILLNLSEAVLTVPQTLHQNSCEVQGQFDRFVAKKYSVFKLLDAIEADSPKGDNLSILYENIGSHTLESVDIKIHLLSTLIQLLQQLLRFDSIIGVKNVHI